MAERGAGDHVFRDHRRPLAVAGRPGLFPVDGVPERMRARLRRRCGPRVRDPPAGDHLPDPLPRLGLALVPSDLCSPGRRTRFFSSRPASTSCRCFRSTTRSASTHRSSGTALAPSLSASLPERSRCSLCLRCRRPFGPRGCLRSRSPISGGLRGEPRREGGRMTGKAGSSPASWRCPSKPSRSNAPCSSPRWLSGTTSSGFAVSPPASSRAPPWRRRFKRWPKDEAARRAERLKDIDRQLAALPRTRPGSRAVLGLRAGLLVICGQLAWYPSYYDEPIR